MQRCRARDFNCAARPHRNPASRRIVTHTHDAVECCGSTGGVHDGVVATARPSLCRVSNVRDPGRERESPVMPARVGGDARLNIWRAAPWVPSCDAHHRHRTRSPRAPSLPSPSAMCDAARQARVSHARDRTSAFDTTRRRPYRCARSHIASPPQSRSELVSRDSSAAYAG